METKISEVIQKVKILIVEDDMIIAADISMQLDQMGYEVTGILPRGEAALKSMEDELPDIVLMDINLKGNMDGIETAQRLKATYQVPIIFLTANSDKVTFERAKVARPQAFIVKPFDPGDLERAIELAMSHIESNRVATDIGIPPTPAIQREEEESTFVLSDRIFVKYKDKMVKLYLKDILYIQAESNYCKIHTIAKEYLLAVTLKVFESKLFDKRFLRVHRSFIANLTELEEVGELYLRIRNEQIPISRSHRDALFQRLKTI